MTKEQLGQLILSSEQQMYATAKTILLNDQDCADAIQETIVKAFSKYQTIKNPKYAKTWLIRILINECYNIQRKESRNVSFDEMEIELADEKETPRDYSALYHEINQLKEDLRIPLILYYMEEFSVREIAHVLEISEGAVQKRLARARKKLKATIKYEEVWT
ncbi:MAG: RNA polymerase sigma factor [Lachnospiraceae bacterium]